LPEKFKRVLILYFIFFLISGCTVRLIYNHLNWIIPWYISDYIDLDDSQNSLLDKKLFAQLKWHRMTQLRSYSAFLRELKIKVNNGLTYEDMDRGHSQMRKFWQDLIAHISPDVAEILSTATDGQINEFLENLKKRNEKYKERYIDPTEEERREKKVARMNRFLDFCMGGVNEEQEKIVDQWSRQLQDISSVRFEFIKISQRRFQTILKNRHNPEPFTKELEEFLYFRRESWTPELRQIAKHNRDLTKRTFLDILSRMTPDQRVHLNEQIDELANVFDELAAEKMDD